MLKQGIFKIVILSFCFILCIEAEAKHCEGCPKNGSDSAGVYQEGSIQNMTKEELNSLVDLLFDFESIPDSLINQIKIACAKFKDKPSLIRIGEPLIPSSEFYTEWDEKELFPKEDMLLLKGDTSVTLFLYGEKQGDYYHPFNGLVTSNFGWRDNKPHNGIDIDVNRGDKIAAAFDGMVRVAKYHGGFGNVVIIRHYNGLETVYAHLSKLKVKPGQVVIAGQLVGLGGSTGHSTGTHLHFEIRFKGVPINPKYIISFEEQQLLYNEVTIKKTKWGLIAHPQNLKYHVVEKGDTILGLAKRFGVSTTSIKQMNCLTGSVRLKQGQIINLVQ